MTDVQPRRASPRDRDLLRELLAADSLPVDGMDDAWRTWVVADDGDGVAGGVAVERHEDPAGAAYLLRSLVVAPPMRGIGVGAALVRFALAAVDEECEDHARVALLTEAADRYFARFGFEAVARTELPTALSASPELLGACPASARAYIRAV